MKKQFSKEIFIELMEALQQENDVVSELYQKYNIDIIDCNWHQSEYYVVKLLQYIFEDEETCWIDWWCWEADFGRDTDLNKIYIPNLKSDKDIEVEINTSEKLYDFLISNIEEEEDSQWPN